MLCIVHSFLIKEHPMLRAFTTFIASTLIASAAFAAATVGEAAPAFKATDVITGKSLTNKDLLGKTVVMEWNNFGCPFVKKFYSVGAMQELQVSATKDGVVWVTVNSSAAGKEGHFANAAEAKKGIAENKLKSSHYLLDHDGSIGKAFGAKTTPHMFVIDKEGKVAYQGAIDNKSSADSADIASATNYVTAALASLKAGTPIKTSVTQPYGCSVKY
jgi:peroxiredoxin